MSTFRRRPAQVEPELQWLVSTRRWGQVNFNERDIASVDLDLWVAYWQKAALQGAPSCRRLARGRP